MQGFGNGLRRTRIEPCGAERTYQNGKGQNGQTEAAHLSFVHIHSLLRKAYARIGSGRTAAAGIFRCKLHFFVNLTNSAAIPH